MKLKRPMRRFLAPAVTLLILAGVTADVLTHPTPDDAAPYHKRVLEAVGKPKGDGEPEVPGRIPKEIGNWSGVHVAVPAAAGRMLHPNAMCSRRYTYGQNGPSVDLLVIHCSDARDMGSHYPPVCYPANGWKLRRDRPVVCRVKPGTVIPAKEYEFTRHEVRQGEPPLLRIIRVVNVLLLPDGTITPNISAVGAARADYRTHFFGAGQVQVVFGERIAPADRDRIFKTFMDAIQPVIAAIGTGVQR